ncbi:MAG: hypothetical protein H0X35_01920 [Pseudonocardiales bacterium]|nr:hypothetical protein [Pseudonocardiales bacterium]
MATDVGSTPGQVGVVLVLGGGLLADLAALLEERVAAVPRLRQRLLLTPIGAGSPIWVDDPR